MQEVHLLLCVYFWVTWGVVREASQAQSHRGNLIAHLLVSCDDCLWAVVGYFKCSHRVHKTFKCCWKLVNNKVPKRQFKTTSRSSYLVLAPGQCHSEKLP